MDPSTCCKCQDQWGENLTTVFQNINMFLDSRATNRTCLTHQHLLITVFEQYKRAWEASLRLHLHVLHCTQPFFKCRHLLCFFVFFSKSSGPKCGNWDSGRGWQGFIQNQGRGSRRLSRGWTNRSKNLNSQAFQRSWSEELKSTKGSDEYQWRRRQENQQNSDWALAQSYHCWNGAMRWWVESWTGFKYLS